MALAVKNIHDRAQGRLPITLRRLTDEFLDLARNLEGLNLDDPSDEARCEELLAELRLGAGNVRQKIAAVAHIIHEREVAAERARDEARIINAFAKADERLVEWLRRYLRDNLLALSEIVGDEGVRADNVHVYLQEGAGALIVEDESLVPDEYKKAQPKKIDNAALKSALESGAEVPGAHIDKSKHVVIR